MLRPSRLYWDMRVLGWLLQTSALYRSLLVTYPARVRFGPEKVEILQESADTGSDRERSCAAALKTVKSMQVGGVFCHGKL